MSGWFGGGGLMFAVAAITSLHGGGCNKDTVEAAIADADIAAVKGDQQHEFGLGADAQVAVASPLWQTLQQRWIDGAWSLRTARTVFYIGLDDEPMDTSRLHEWVTAVTQAGLEPMVSVSLHHTKGASLLARPEFRARFETLLHEFPDVVYWSVVNEPDLDLPGSPTERAGTAVDYFVDGWHVLRSCKQQHKCASMKLVAGEFSYQGATPSTSETFWQEYGNKLLSALKNKQIWSFPRIWAFHPYTDTSGASTDGTARFVKFLDTLEGQAGLTKNSLRAWLTESGTLLHHGSTCATSVGDLNYDSQGQYNGAYTVYYLNDLQRVDRIYWWHFQQVAGQEHTWDSAMVDSNGVPRPSFCALTNQPIDLCSGNLAATQCESDPSLPPCGGPCPVGSSCDGTSCVPDAPVYRFWSESVGDHFYTLDASGEIALAIGYVSEGVGFHALSCASPGTTILYRWVSAERGDHFYTVSIPDDFLPSIGYTLEGDIGCVATASAEGLVPLHRWWNEKLTDHFYTVDSSGDAFLQGIGYVYEGIEGYVGQP